MGDPVLLPPLGWNSNWHWLTNVNNGGERFLVTQCTLQLGCDSKGREGEGGGWLERGGVKTS